MTEPPGGVPQPVSPADTAAPPEIAAPAVNGEADVSLARMPESEAAPPSEAERASASSVDLALPPATPPAPAAPPMASVAPVAVPAVDVLSPLEQRIRRIEDALAHLQVQREPETRVAVPVAASSASPASTAALLDMGKRLFGVAADAITPTPAPAPTFRGRALWLLWDTWAEARAILRMFVDPRYHLPWSARVLPLALLAAILTSKFWVPGSSIPFLGDWLLVKIVDLLLAFVLFKWLGHEARRYRQTSPDLPPTLRL